MRVPVFVSAHVQFLLSCATLQALRELERLHDCWRDLLWLLLLFYVFLFVKRLAKSAKDGQLALLKLFLLLLYPFLSLPDLLHTVDLHGTENLVIYRALLGLRD